MKTAYFNCFHLCIPAQAVTDCSHQDDCDGDVTAWAARIIRPIHITPEKLAAEIKEYGCWDEDELKDDYENWKRIIWIAAGNIKEEECLVRKSNS